ncbi:MAG: PASTA domain-containing protein, partial [Bacilli bacterium]
VQVSNGPNPDEKIDLIDFSKTNLQAAQDFIDKNKLFGINIELEYSDTINKNSFISQVFSNDLVSETNYKRSDSLKLVYSKGKKPIIKDIKVEDFKGKQKSDVETWATKKKVNVKYNEDFSNDYVKGQVISQSINPEEKISTVDELVFNISKGKGIVIPNYANYNYNNAMNANSDIKVNIKTIYSRVTYGTLISQSISSGSIVSSEEANVDVIYSEGLPYISNLIGKNGKEIEEYFKMMNDKGANIRYMVYYEDAPSEDSKGLVIRASINNGYIDFNSEMYVVIVK